MGTQAPTAAPTPAPRPAPTPAPTSSARLIGSGCCRDFKVILISTHDPLTRSECEHKCLDHPACNAFAVSGCSSSSAEACGAGCHIYELDQEEGPLHMRAMSQMASQ